MLRTRLAGALVALVVALAMPTGALASFGDEAVGMNAHVPTAEVVDLVADLGASWIRVDADWWAQSAPCSASIGFSAALDQAVVRADQRGLRVFMTLAYTPPCASSGDGDGKPHNEPPDPAKYGAFVRQAVAHYRALGVTHFGLWNEANLTSFWEGSASDYVTHVVAPGIPAIAAGCSDAGHGDCKALGPDTAHTGDYDVWLEDVLDGMNAAGLSFDILTHHCYLGFDLAIWDGDSFVNALDQRRAEFTRRSLLDVLKDTGHAPGGVPDIEVWMTETGYQCEPADDAGEKQKQADYYQRVLDEQLARTWYTNTFFYEITDSGDALDGFGITRGPGHAHKPAYDALKARIASEPALQSGPEAACANGDDDDGDGLVDLADPGCADADDDDEADGPSPPAKPTLVALPASAGQALDGSLDDWAAASFVTIASPADFVSAGGAPGDASDLSARIAVAWEPGAVWLGVEVQDDAHVNDHAAADLWMADGLQVAFDVATNGGAGYDDTDDFELGWASTTGGSVSFVWHAPPGSSAKGGDFVVARSGTKTTYEVRIPAGELGLADVHDGLRVGFSLVVDDDDGGGREGFIEWSTGIGLAKSPADFGRVAFALTAPPVGAGGSGAGAGGPGLGGAGVGGAGVGGASAGVGGADGGGASGIAPRAVDGGAADDASGCGCRVARGGRGAEAVALLVAFAWVARRRRRAKGGAPRGRRPSATER
jgi:hypothetical protein